MTLQHRISDKLVQGLNKQHHQWLGETATALKPEHRAIVLGDLHSLYTAVPKRLRDLNAISYLSWMVKRSFPVLDITTMAQAFDITPAACRQLEWKCTQIVKWMVSDGRSNG